MSNLEVCECGKWRTKGGTHACHPRWESRVVDEGEEWTGEFYASDAEEAAEKAGGEYDNHDHTLAKGGEVVIEVRRITAPHLIQRFRVTGEATVDYRADLLEPPDPAE